MRRSAITFLFVLSLFLLCSCGGEEYVPQMTREQAITCALEEGQRYLVEEFVEWKSWEDPAAEFQSIALELMVDGKHERTDRIWHVVFTDEDDTRSVHFVVDDCYKRWSVAGTVLMRQWTGRSNRGRSICIRRKMRLFVRFYIINWMRSFPVKKGLLCRIIYMCMCIWIILENGIVTECATLVIILPEK